MGGEEKDGVYESLLKDVCSPSTNRRLDAWSKIQGKGPEREEERRREKKLQMATTTCVVMSMIPSDRIQCVCVCCTLGSSRENSNFPANRLRFFAVLFSHLSLFFVLMPFDQACKEARI